MADRSSGPNAASQLFASWLRCRRRRRRLFGMAQAGGFQTGVGDSHRTGVGWRYSRFVVRLGCQPNVVPGRHVQPGGLLQDPSLYRRDSNRRPRDKSVRGHLLHLQGLALSRILGSIPIAPHSPSAPLQARLMIYSPCPPTPAGQDSPQAGLS